MGSHELMSERDRDGELYEVKMAAFACIEYGIWNSDESVRYVSEKKKNNRMLAPGLIRTIHI